MNYNQIICLACLMILAVGCNKQTTMSKTISQGVTGKVILFQGNQMPTVGVEMPSGKPVEREIYFCKPVKMGELEDGGVVGGTIFQGVEPLLIKKTQSDEKGSFSIELPAGKYSVFTKEETGFFANSFDGDGYIHVVEVKEGEVAEMTIQINYQAVF